MGESLLVHTIDNNIENIEILTSEDNGSKDGIYLIGTIVKEQLEKLLENANLYYLEDDKCAKRKKDVFNLEYINYIWHIVINNYKNNNITQTRLPLEFKNIQLNENDIDISMIKKILSFLIMTDIENLESIQVGIDNKKIVININLEKIKEHSLQSE